MAESRHTVYKQDHRFAGEPLGDEGTAWSRAVDLVSGQYGLDWDGWNGRGG